ncbi:MAG TPA: hypothetical protein HA263_00030 [Methanoregulaceae archaeon]|nr:hypothetical protein [Methanoregulaceae archaeon]
MTSGDDQRAAADALGTALVNYLRSATGRGIALIVIDRREARPAGPTFGALRRLSP